MMTTTDENCTYDTDWIKTFCVKCDEQLTDNVVDRYERQGNFCNDCSAAAGYKAFRQVRLGLV